MQVKDDFSAAPVSQAEGFQLPPLYRLGAYDKAYVWIIGFDGTCLVMHWGTVEDMEKGSLQWAKTEVETNLSGRTLQEQAILEAKSRWKRKQDRDGYSEKFIDPNILNMPAMLANTWDPEKNQIKRWPVWVQEKLDGIRCRANRDENGKAFLISRNKLVLNNFDHIRHELELLFPFIETVLKEFLTSVEPVFRIDGELYTRDLSFDRISGITRLKKSRDPEEHLIQYYMFDLVVPGEWTYDERWYFLQEAFKTFRGKHPSRNLHILVPRLANSKEDILKAHAEYVEQGYEGIIIRKIGGVGETRKESLYVGRRTSNILKYKSFLDEEGIVIGADQGKGTEEGAVVWIVQNQQGKSFSVRPRGSIETRRRYYQAWLQDPNQFLTLKYRYRYQELTPEGLPRFPIGLGFVFDR